MAANGPSGVTSHTAFAFQEIASAIDKLEPVQDTKFLCALALILAERNHDIAFIREAVRRALCAVMSSETGLEDGNRFSLKN